MPGIHRVSAKTVIGVVDTGIDPTHVDLYLNVWLNQGEIPSTLRSQLTDIDGDGLITFYDLNNATRATTAPYALTINGFASGPNRTLVRDLNANGRIDADDLLNNPAWGDGRDTDLNGFADDLFGVNFRSGSVIRLHRIIRSMSWGTARTWPEHWARSAATLQESWG